MPDNKLKDNEIKKVLECCIGDTEGKNCFDCPLYEIDDCQAHMYLNSLDLINHLQAKVIKEQNKNSKLRNERNRLQAQNKELSETIHNLTIEKDALFDKAEELKAEVERLAKETKDKERAYNDEFCLRKEWKTKCQELLEEKQIAKAEAIEEFAERLKNEIINDTAYACDSTQHSGYYDYQIKIGDIPEYIDNLVKEMVGEDK